MQREGANYGLWQEEPETVPVAGKDETGELARAYQELGREYYEGRFEDPLPELLPLFDKITRLRQSAPSRGSFCPACGAPVKAGSRFCGACGGSLG